MSRKPAKSVGMSPVLAVLLLVACGAIAGWSLFGRGTTEEPPPPVSSEDVMLPLPDSDGGSGAADPGAPLRVDLLARLGSFDQSVMVPHVFVKPVAEAVAATPGGEIAPVAVDGWVGADPPQLTLSVTMVSGPAQRALLQGAVVGVGDSIGGCVVTEVTRETVVLLGGDGRTLTYDFDLGWPREFRATLAKRSARAREREQAEAAGGKPAGGEVEVPASAPTPEAVPAIDQGFTKEQGK